jgi:glycosyltransferase involved in cell wall biosynthesis
MITAIILSYNHGHVIGKTIESILAQDEPFLELIVSDDHSTDNTEAVVRRYSELDERIVFIRPERNMGMPGNANFAVSQARTEYIALLHHDDIYMKTAFSEWKAVLDKYDDVAYVYNASYDEYGGCSIIDPHPYRRVEGERFLFDYLLPRWASPVWGAAFIRKSAWDAVGGMKTRYGSIADVYLWMELAAKFAVGYVPKPLFQIMHDRPIDYPGEYSSFSWKRHANLINIHGDIRKELQKEGRLNGKDMLWFRLKASILTLKWICYAIIKNKTKMLQTIEQSKTPYDLPCLGALVKIVALIPSSTVKDADD